MTALNHQNSRNLPGYKLISRIYKALFSVVFLLAFLIIIIVIATGGSDKGINEVYGESFLERLKRVTLLTAEKIRGSGLSEHEAMWYRRLIGGEVQCLLCPFRCIIGEGKRGVCGVRANIGGRLRALTYGKPVVTDVEPIEKGPFFHYLPGTRTLVVATVGCNLRCNFCQNWTIALTLPENESHMDLSPAEVIELAKAKNCEAIEFAASEPTVFYEYMYETAKLARDAGIRTLLKTAGYINPEPMKELCKYIDAVNIDIKSMREDFYRDYCAGSLQPVLDIAKLIRETDSWLEVAYLVIPEGNDEDEEIEAVSRWVKDNLGADTPLHFTRFIPNYKLADRPPTPFETLERAVEIASRVGLKYVYVVIVPGNPYEDTYCPVCKRKVIDRDGFLIVENHITKEGRCEYCGSKISGVFP